MKNIIRIETLTIIDAVDLLSVDIMDYGVSLRQQVNKSHQEKFLVLLNKFRFLLKSTKPNK